ncbi:MAG: glycosyltransferase family 1 protein [Candidatus Pacebacteria bacterium]|nr:glycosyltransferase family 1 protein [Candidatus Paceibacterota bacterium]
MLKNKVIIIPIENAWNHSADFLRQTALVLSKHNLVYIYDHNNHYFFGKKNRKNVYPTYKNIIFHQAKYYLPFERFKIIDKFNRWLSFKLFLEKHRRADKILWIFYPNYYDFAQMNSQKMLKIYDCVDYSENHQEENILINSVDYFFVNSKALKNLYTKRELNKQAIYISAQGFFQPDDKKIKSVPLKKGKNKVVIGYIGGLNYRLNYPLLDQLISNHPEWLFVFYGPEQNNVEKDKVYHTQKWIKKLKQHKNTLFSYSSDRYFIYGLIKNFDVAIIPYNTDIIFNKYCYPMKIFEYFYMGKPVVTNPIVELNLQKFNNLIKISKENNDWEKNIEYFLKNKLSAQKKQVQKTLAKNNSWEYKLNAIGKYLLLN